MCVFFFLNTPPLNPYAAELELFTNKTTIFNRLDGTGWCFDDRNN